MSPHDAQQREAIAERLERRGDRYRNAGDDSRADAADLLARAARAAPTVEDARALESGADPTARPPGFWRRLRDRFRGQPAGDDS
jgi:hypothetical protein